MNSKNFGSQFHDGTSQDMIIVDGNKTDLNEYADDCFLIEQVWLRCKPPSISTWQECTVPTRKIQLVRKLLTSTTNCVCTLMEDSRPQIEENIKARRLRRKRSECVPISSYDDEQN